MRLRVALAGRWRDPRDRVHLQSGAHPVRPRGAARSTCRRWLLGACLAVVTTARVRGGGASSPTGSASRSAFLRPSPPAIARSSSTRCCRAASSVTCTGEWCTVVRAGGRVWRSVPSGWERFAGQVGVGRRLAVALLVLRHPWGWCPGAVRRRGLLAASSRWYLAGVGTGSSRWIASCECSATTCGSPCSGAGPGRASWPPRRSQSRARRDLRAGSTCGRDHGPAVDPAPARPARARRGRPAAQPRRLGTTRGHGRVGVRRRRARCRRGGGRRRWRSARWCSWRTCPGLVVLLVARDRSRDDTRTADRRPSAAGGHRGRCVRA